MSIAIQIGLPWTAVLPVSSKPEVSGHFVSEHSFTLEQSVYVAEWYTGSTEGREHLDFTQGTPLACVDSRGQDLCTPKKISLPPPHPETLGQTLVKTNRVEVYKPTLNPKLANLSAMGSMHKRHPLPARFSSTGQQ